MGRIGLLIIALLVGIASASLIPDLAQSVRKAIGLAPGPSAAQSSGTPASERREQGDEKLGVVTYAGSNQGRWHRDCNRGGRHLDAKELWCPERSFQRRSDRQGLCETVGHRGGVAKEYRRSSR